MKRYLIIIALLIVSCKPEIRIIEKLKIDTVKVVSPIIEDSLKAKIINDTLIEANKLKNQDTVIVVKYFPVEKKFYIKAKPDTIKLIKIDTLYNTQIIEKENFFDKIKTILIICIILIMFLFIIKIIRG